MATATGCMSDSPPPRLDPASDALFLDFDGTLVELADTPHGIAVPAGLASLLERLSGRLGGRIAVVSGRSLEDLRHHLGGVDLLFAGSHGAELAYPGGRCVRALVPEGLEAARGRIAAFAAARPGLLVEEKPAGIALHYRGAPELEAESRAHVEAVAKASGMAVVAGKMVAELRPRGFDKGEALRRLMAEPPYAGARPWFVGDDVTDEDAFRAAAELGGEGVLVGSSRPTAAGWRLEGVRDVIRWLEAAAHG